MQAVCNHTPNMQQFFFNMAYDNYNPMLQQARIYSILSCCFKGTKTINSPSHLVLADNLRGPSLSGWVLVKPAQNCGVPQSADNREMSHKQVLCSLPIRACKITKGKSAVFKGQDYLYAATRDL
jgi:hypothetical protein